MMDTRVEKSKGCGKQSGGMGERKEVKRELEREEGLINGLGM